MKRKAIIPLVLGLGIGLFTVKLAVDTIRKAQAASKTAQTVKVVRATQDIRPYEQISPEMVEVVETTESIFVPASDRFDTVDVVIGRVAKKAIPERTPVLGSMLAPEGTKPGLIGRIPPGFRAVSVKIDEVTGVAYQIRPGDWVDVCVVMDINAADGRGKDTISEVILQNVQVAAIGHTTDVDATDQGTKVKPAKSATLFVRDEDVPKLHLASTRGKISLAMRGDDQQVTQAPATANMGDVVSHLRVPPSFPQLASSQSAGEMPFWMKALGFGADEPGPSKSDDTPKVVLAQQLVSELPPSPPHTVMVYRGAFGKGKDEGTNVEQITFENADSPNVVEVTKGPPTRASATLGGSDRNSGAKWRQGTTRGAQRTGSKD